MYFVKYGNSYLHDPRAEEYILIDLSLDCEENTCGYCDFTIYPSHPMYSKLKERDAGNPVEVYDDDILLFSGFIYELGIEFELDGLVKCKGELAYLSDSIVRPYSTLVNGYGEGCQPPNSVDGYFEWLIAQHNNQVEDDKRFYIGVNRGSELDSNNYIYRESTKYPTTWDEINDKIFDELGGYLRVRHVDGIRYIDLLSEWVDTNAQVLDFGKTLTNYTQTDDSETIATFVLPLGARMGETGYTYDDGYYKTADSVVDSDKTYYTRSENGYTKCDDDMTSFDRGVNYYEYYDTFDETNLSLTIEGLEDKEYESGGYIKSGDIIYCESAVKKYGWIGAKYENVDISTKEQLIAKSIISLKDLISPKRTIEIKAVDMHLINPTIKPIRIGEYVRVRSNPHDIDGYFLCTSISLDLNNPENSTYILGTTYDTLTGQQNKRIKLLNSSINQTYEQAEKLTEREKQNALSVDAARKDSKEAKATVGLAVMNIVDEYALSESSSSPPSTEWSTDTPLWDKGLYVWRRTVQTYGDGSMSIGAPALMTGNSGEDATTLRIESSRGIVFKNDSVATMLSVVIYRGSQRITDSGTMKTVFGDKSHLQWEWLKSDDESFGIIPSDDPRFDNDGFSFMVSPENLDTKITFMCELIL